MEFATTAYQAGQVFGYLIWIVIIVAVVTAIVRKVRK